MQGIQNSQYQEILKALEKFEGLLPLFGNIVPQGKEDAIRDIASQLKGEYDYYRVLVRELENCIQSYEEKHASLRKAMFPYIRRMNTKYKNK